MAETNTVIKSKKNRCEMGKFQREAKTDITRWKEVIKLYKVSKLTSKLIDRFSLKGLCELTGYSLSYISGVEGLHKKPSEDFIQKLETLNETIR